MDTVFRARERIGEYVSKKRKVLRGTDLFECESLVTKVLPGRGDYKGPDNRLLREKEGFEFRSYSSKLEECTTVGIPKSTAINSRFRILSGHIFGGNQKGQSIALTTPVPHSDHDQSFVILAGGNKTTFPKPKDPDLELVEVSEQVAGGRLFSGWSRETVWLEQKGLLLKELEKANISVDGVPGLVQYIPPRTASSLPRNEVLVRFSRENYLASKARA